MKLALLLLLVACHDREHDLIRDKPAKTGSGSAIAMVPPPLAAIDTMKYTLPSNWTAEYDKATKLWIFSTKASDGRPVYAHLQRFDAALAPKPEDYLEMRRRLWDKGTTAEISEQHALADGGFEMTVTVKPAIDPTRPKRETYVVRKSGGSYIDCQCEWVPDDAIREQVISVCRSATL